LHYYGEPGETGADDAAGDTLGSERHLDECGECRALYASLERVLNVVDGLPMPERSADYGAQVWQRIERRIDQGAGARRRSLWMPPSSWRWAEIGRAYVCTPVTDQSRMPSS